jgi:hypothetical protein
LALQVTLEWAMSACVDLVAGQLSAVWTSDWAALRQTLCSDPELQISHGDWSQSEWEIGNFYRYISQAWDFMPGAVELSDEGDGIVQAKMRLTNGGGWQRTLRANIASVEIGLTAFG